MNLKTLYNYFLTFITKGSQRSVKAKKNIIASFGIKGVSVLIGLIKVPVILLYLDVEKYGVWLTIASIVDWVQYFDLGMGHGLRNKFAEALANRDKDRARKLVSTAYFYITLIFLGISVLLIPMVYVLNWQNILNTTLVPENELKLSAFIVLLMFVFRFIFYQISIILKADQRPALSDVFLPIASIITLGWVLILNKISDNSLLFACMAISIPPVIVLLFANLWFFNKNYRYYKPSLKFVERKMFKDIFSLGVKFFIVQLAGLIMFASSNIILTQVVNPSEVSLYNISRQYFNIPFMVFGIILMPFWSAITDAYTRQEFHWIKQAMKKLFYLGLLFSLGVTIMLLISPFAYKIWLGDAIHIPFKLSVVTAIMFIFYIMFAPFSHFINGVGKLSLGIRIGVVKMLLFLPVAILLTNYLSAVGLVLAMILVNAIPTALIEPLQYKKIVNKQAHGIWNK